jgi:hypothetical protein
VDGVRITRREIQVVLGLFRLLDGAPQAAIQLGSTTRHSLMRRPASSRDAADMIRRRSTRKLFGEATPQAFRNVHDWVLSLPWVIERPRQLGASVRLFAVDCEPLQRRQVWLMTGFGGYPPIAGTDLAAIFPADAGDAALDAGWEVHRGLLPENHLLVSLRSHAPHTRTEIEALVLTSYAYAMS